MKYQRWLPNLLAAWFMMAAVNVHAADKPLKVVTTLSTFADLVKTIGGDHVDVSAIASPKFNAHFIEPKPSDVVKVQRADLFLHAGLDLELWRGPLLDAAGNTRLFAGQPGELDLSQGIPLLEVPTGAVSRSQGDIHIYGNPHYWVDPENAIIMAKAIAAKLSALDPDHAAAYDERMRAWTRQLSQRIEVWRQAARAIRGHELVAYHNEWPYLLNFLGLHAEQFLEPKPGIPPTPKQVQFLERYMKERHIRGIIQSTYFPKDAAGTLAKRTGATVVLLCQSVGEVPHASDYIAMTDYNIQQLTHALGGT
ncbi:MAG: zinc ABC transporter substrate-binding protein [Candidatus Omnitrophica bacterium]|nr:zinc ABC transporter substrate-binding protein [Candidatus Omnitrophota bacterium]